MNIRFISLISLPQQPRNLSVLLYLKVTDKSSYTYILCIYRIYIFYIQFLNILNTVYVSLY